MNKAQATATQAREAYLEALADVVDGALTGAGIETMVATDCREAMKSALEYIVFKQV